MQNFRFFRIFSIFMKCFTFGLDLKKFKISNRKILKIYKILYYQSNIIRKIKILVIFHFDIKS